MRNPQAKECQKRRLRRTFLGRPIADPSNLGMKTVYRKPRGPLAGDGGGASAGAPMPASSPFSEWCCPAEGFMEVLKLGVKWTVDNEEQLVQSDALINRRACV